MLKKTSENGMTLIEMMIVIAVLGVVATIAIPSYQNYIDKTNNALAVARIEIIQSVIQRFYMQEYLYPATLQEIAGSLPDDGLDPWGNLYVYLNIADGWPATRGPARKDRALNPINTQYDLYSRGKDGKTKKQVSNRDSLDDIILARDGRFIGLASDF